jgi:thiamine-monophosphate kinase
MRDKTPINEEALLALIRKELPLDDPSVVVGSGDDCAIVEPPPYARQLVLKTDATIENIHFVTQDNLSNVGWKALCRPISDFAAMGAIPQHALITVASPAIFEEAKWLQLARGIGKAARAFNITIVGGEITRSPGPLFLSVTLTGSEGRRSSLRSYACTEDLICVTGALGGSFKSGRHLTFTPRLAEGQWLAEQHDVHAMIDLSDGLGSDLPRLARASNTSFILEKEKIPCHAGCHIDQAISDGEDYELLLTVALRGWPDLQQRWSQQFPTLPLTPIGTIVSPDHLSSSLPSGFDHWS